jgi:SAM-dependent methyltransferase
MAPGILDAEGDLSCTKCGARYAIRGGIPRFVGRADDRYLSQVKDAFSFKWTRDAWGFAPEHREVMLRFFCDRFGFAGAAEIAAFFRGKTVLHAGIGNGQEEQHYLHHCREVWGADISESVDRCQRNWREHHPALADRLRLCQADLMALPFADGSFDLVLSDGVLHHTPDTRAALTAIVRKVRDGGHVMFYVYKKKGPIREFVDDYVRGQISALPPAEAWKALEPLTALARDLSRQHLTIEVPENIELLGMAKGRQDLQRWLYWNVMKFYWNEAFSFDENNHVNFDWYYPFYAWRSTQEDVQDWLDQLNLTAEWFQVGDSGISVIARKNAHRNPV